MTTATKEDVYLPWDYFFSKMTTTEHDKAAVNGYRRAEWKNIWRELRQQYRWDVSVGLEPHWVAPAKAVYWHQRTTYKREFVSNSGEQPITHTVSNLEMGHWARVKVSEGEWIPTGPLPAYAGAIAHYLEKGFRLRPPQDGVEDAIKRESADLLEASGEQDQPKVIYYCQRHADKGKMGFINWKAYIQHCDSYGEVPTADPPPEVLAKIKNFHWYCPIHDKGWKENQRKLAEQHYTSARRKPGGQNHPTVTDMLVNKEGKK